MPGVKLTTQAYCKMVLHGAKYPHCAVNGLLVAEKQKPRKEHLPLGGPGAHHTLFVDCIPLFHGTLALAPMLEVALTLDSEGPQKLPAPSLPYRPSTLLASSHTLTLTARQVTLADEVWFR
ncbi:ER membrane protein complex subunit 8, partial [Eschrichtius robustus]|nr:ER membrane protein complex subunit 8 [Eschrichtius robustus]